MTDMSTSVKDLTWPGWEVVRVIGQGSFGAVYEIRREVFGHEERAALKWISIPRSENEIRELISEGFTKESITKRFEGYLQDIVREYSIMADMKSCANVVSCDDVKYVQRPDGIGWDIYIKMELLTPLPQAVGESVPEEQVLRIARDMCLALVSCGERNIIHRDIKPQNIFMAPDGTYKLGDFGIAKTAEGTASGTKTGTYRYMAPEVYSGQPYGVRADIYSLGLSLYWLLNDRRTPFLPLPPAVPDPEEEAEARRRRFSGETIPEPVHGSEGLKAIVMKACAFAPEDRYASAAEMLAALEKLADAPQVTAAAAAPKKNAAAEETPPAKSAGKKKKGGLVIAVLALLCAALVFLFLRPGAGEKEDKTGTALSEGETALMSEQIESDMLGGSVTVADPLLELNNTEGLAIEAEPGQTSISLDETELNIGAGEDCKLTPTLELALSESGALADNDVAIRWTSSDPEVAAVAEDGTITAVGVGTATITAALIDEEASASCTVNVRQKVTGVKFAQAARALRAGSTYKLQVIFSPKNATYQDLIWSSSNPAVVTVDQTGKISAVGTGKADVMITTVDGGFTATCHITVRGAKGRTATPGNAG